MKTVDKAIKVLDQFSLEVTEVGLTELSRMSDLDKAATRRLLVALSKHGLIEQNQDTRKYRLGPGFLRLAAIREATVPMAKAAQEVCDWLLDVCDESVHISVPLSNCMATIAYCVPRRGNVINIESADALYFHATSSGIAFTAFASEATRTRILALKRDKVTPETKTSAADVAALIAEAQKLGYGQSSNSFENGVASLAMPFSAGQVDPAGCIAIALPDSKLTSQRSKELLPLLREAVQRMEQSLKG